MPRAFFPSSFPSVTVRSTVLGLFVGSITLVPRATTLPSASIVHLPSAALTTVIFLASSSPALFQSTSSDTTCQVPSYFLRSFLTASSLASPAARSDPRPTNNRPTPRANACCLMAGLHRGNEAFRSFYLAGEGGKSWLRQQDG